MCVALSLGLLGCQRPSNIKFDESGLYFIVEEDSYTSYEPRIRPYFEGYGGERAERHGMVPDKETAIKIAESVWYPIYGSEVYNERPFIAELEGDTVWVVEGSLPKGKIGGSAKIRLRKSDAAVLYVGHPK
jgi:hypothetical protein